MMLRSVLGAGALLAVAITGALALRRTLQLRRRQPGETIAVAPRTFPAEAKSAAAAEPYQYHLPGHAIRYLVDNGAKW